MPPRSQHRDDHGYSPLVRHPGVADSRSRRYRDGPAVPDDHTIRDAHQPGSRIASDCTNRHRDHSTCRAADDTATGQRYRPPRTAVTGTDSKCRNSHARRDGLASTIPDSRCQPTAITGRDCERHPLVRSIDDGCRVPDDAIRDHNDADGDHANGRRSRHCDCTRLPDCTYSPRRRRRRRVCPPRRPLPRYQHSTLPACKYSTIPVSAGMR